MSHSQKPSRLFIYIADVQAITGKSESACRRLLVRLRKSLGKKPYESISIFEFCDYLRLPIEQVAPFLI